MKLKIGLPIGSLQSATIDMMRRAGYNVTLHARSYYPSVDDDDLEARLIRPQDMSRFVEKGVVDCGITGTEEVKLAHELGIEVIITDHHEPAGIGIAGHAAQ